MCTNAGAKFQKSHNLEFRGLFHWLFHLFFVRYGFGKLNVTSLSKGREKCSENLLRVTGGR